MFTVSFLGIKEQFETIKSSLKWILSTIKADGHYSLDFEEKYSYRNLTVATIYNEKNVPIFHIRSNTDMETTVFSIVRMADEKELKVLNYIYCIPLEDEKEDF